MHHSRFRFHHYRNSQTTYAIQRAHCHHQCTEHSVDIGRESRYHPHRDGRRVQSAYPFTDRKDGSRLTQRFPCQQIIPRHSRNISGHEPDLSKPQRPDGKIGHDKGCRRSHPGSRFFQNRDKRIRKFRVDNYGELLHHRQSYLEREYWENEGEKHKSPDWIIEREKETRPSYPFILYYKYKYNLPAFPCLFISLTERTGFSQGLKAFHSGTECHSVLESLHPLSEGIRKEV